MKKMLNVNLEKINKNYFLILSIILIFLYLLPYIILQEDSKVYINDALDEIVWTSGLIFSHNHTYLSKSWDKKIPTIMNGLPRFSLSSDLNIYIQLFRFLEPFNVYVINQFLLRIIAFFGMFLLTKNHLLKYQSNDLYLMNLGTSLSFSFLPFWANFSASVAIVPLILFAFLNIRKKEYQFYNWLILIIAPFYSSLIYIGIFIILLFLFIITYDLFKSKSINKNLVLSLIIISITYIFVEHRLFQAMIINDSFLSHRVDFQQSNNLNFKGLIYVFMYILTLGHFHANPLTSPILILSLAISIILICKNIKNKKLDDTDHKILLIISFMCFSSILYALTMYEPYNALIKKTNVSLINSFQYNRFYFLFPALWHMIFFLSLFKMTQLTKKFRLLVIFLILSQLTIAIKNHELIINKGEPSFKDFFKEKQFEAIKNHINKPQNMYKVASIGLHPSISIYNGFQTIDGYVANYPLQYKHDFRRIIEKELEKSQKLKNHFDHWGSRCYLYSSEMYLNPDIDYIDNLDLDSTHLKKMGANYIFSSAKISNPKDNGLIYEKVFSNNTNFKKNIYLYRVK